ncbi:MULTISPECIES: hypothetical protein [unclassified Pseudovibrio]|uniref:hypothetical protein n=1 Tax=unclassified Pseudovibrio TaxID=2627060 RepID=UPI001FCBCBED|nr:MULTISPECIES: hypothetical protein [unclassified Pseudovibrio]
MFLHTVSRASGGFTYIIQSAGFVALEEKDFDTLVEEPFDFGSYVSGLYHIARSHGREYMVSVCLLNAVLVTWKTTVQRHRAYCAYNFHLL